MNKCEGHIMLPKSAAIDQLVKESSFNPGVEEVALEEAFGRIAAEDVHSVHTLPNMNSSRMDGIAVHFSAFEGGIPDTSGWKEGEDYVFNNCGVGIPGDFDTVIRIEDVDLDDAGRLIVHAAPTEKGQWMTPPGSTVKEGDLLVAKSSYLTPFLISRLAMGGHARVSVYRKPIVAFIPTGNELVPAGETVPSGMNVDSNSHMMRAKVVQWSGEPLVYPIQKDDPEAIEATMADALERADIVVVNAGSSQGRLDFTVEVLEKLGRVLSHIIMNGPGAHTSCTVANNGKPIVGIPGPAVGAECTVDWFVKPLIDTYYGRDRSIPKVTARYAGEPEPYTGPSNGWARIVRGMLFRDDNGEMCVKTVSFEDGAAMDASNAFVPITSEGMNPGDILEVELRYPYRAL